MLVFLNMFPSNQPEVMIAHAEERFDQEGKFDRCEIRKDSSSRSAEPREWTRRMGTPPRQSRVKTYDSAKAIPVYGVLTVSP